MNSIFTVQTLFLLIIFFSSTLLLQAIEICPYFSCNLHRHDPIQFPFWVPRNQTNRCGFPGFELSCNSYGQTLVNLPSSNSSNNTFIIQDIDYSYQALLISDPDNCIPNRILNSDLNLTGSQYWWDPENAEYTFLNCSNLNDPTRAIPDGISVISCLSGRNFKVVSTTEKSAEELLVRELKCEVIKRVVVPLWWREGAYPVDMSDVAVQLNWEVPGCQNCVIQGGVCGFSGESSLSVGCFLSGGRGYGRSRLSWGVKYGLILGLGLPGLLCIIGLTLFIINRVKAYNHNHNRSQLAANNNTVSSTSLAIFPQPVILTLGLDNPTIESYPKTTLGESRRLPLPGGHVTCPICLSEYQPKDTLRSIPECNHYFHVECIDEWLRLNATCPLCRNSPLN